MAQWLSMDAAIDTALANNPELAAAYEEIEGKKWTVIAARRRWLPTLTIEPTQDSSLQFNVTTSSDPSSQPNSISKYINQYAAFEWSFFDATRGPGIHAAIDELKAQRLLFDIAARNLVLSVQAAHYKVQEQMRLLDQYRLIALLSTRLLDQAVEQQASGMTSANEVAQLRTTQRAQLRYFVDSFVSLYDASTELSRLIGLPLQSMVLASDQGASQYDWQHSEEGTLAHAEKFREEIQAALQQSRAERWRASELIGFYWPKFSLASIGTQEDGERSATYGVTLRWSLFDGGIKAAEAANRRSAAKTYTLKAQSSRLQVAAEVRQAYIRFFGASLNVENSAAEVTDSWNAYYGAIQLFGANKVEATTLIQTQAQLVEAITDAEAAQRLQNTAVAELYRYSARWPSDVQRLFEQRLEQWRQRGVSP